MDTLATRIRERELQRYLLHEAATHDPLTGLLNRAAVLEHLTNDVSRRRQAGETVAVIFIDLDRLKPLNDTYGHEAGDAAILGTGIALLEATGTCDVVGRLGGDEFLLVLCHEHSCEGDAVAERIRQSVMRRSIPVRDSFVPLEASVGVALAQCDSDTDPMSLVHQADEAMYEAKKAARAIARPHGCGHASERRSSAAAELRARRRSPPAPYPPPVAVGEHAEVAGAGDLDEASSWDRRRRLLGACRGRVDIVLEGQAPCTAPRSIAQLPDALSVSLDHARHASYWPRRPGLGHTGMSPIIDSHASTTASSCRS